MKKILFWSMIPPINEYSAQEILAKDMIGFNTGNLLFHNSVVRALMVDENMPMEIYFGGHQDDLDAYAEKINAECSCFVMPLANAFRENYMGKLGQLTKFIQKLTIPCVVVGVGMQASDIRQVREGFAYDGKVRAFVKAVLERSVMLGIRGEVTAEYLKHLGFLEDTHFRVIGCPSMYTFGADLPVVRKKELTAQSKVAVNGKIESSAAIHALMRRGCEELPNYWYIPQTLPELWLMYGGVPLVRTGRASDKPYIPIRLNNPLLKEGRSISFLNVSSWLRFMRDMDFSYGCNIHGNVAAFLSGVPALIVADDLRVAELARYHELPVLGRAEISESMRIADVYERADYGPVNANHGKRFERYVSFLQVNGLKNIYENGGSVPEAPYDRRLAKAHLAPPIQARLPMTAANRWSCRAMYERAAQHYWSAVKRKCRGLCK